MNIRKTTDKRLVHNRERKDHPCKYCGKKIKFNYEFCYNCGKKRGLIADEKPNTL
jgi:predicted amidophosphoribosyltransferase